MQINNIANWQKIYEQKSQAAVPAANLAKPGPAVSPAARTPTAPRSMPAMIAASGLPADRLSASIISFARFFSLPIKPQLMASIRRQVFAKAGQNPEIAAKNREALALAATAAAGKGLELKAEGLENFAKGIDPHWQGRQKQKKGSGQNEKNDGKEIQKADIVSGALLGKKLIELMEKEPLFKILNRIPCKNGKKWVVLPFKIDDSGREFNVSLRILVDTAHHSSKARHACRMAVDISENNKFDKRWLFLLDEAKTKLTMFIQPFFNEKKIFSFANKISHLLEIPVERISVKLYTESFPEEVLHDLLHIVDESV